MIDYILFLDDERFPIYNDKYDTRIARTVENAMKLVKTRGIPIRISFDHDLGLDTGSGLDFAKAFCNYLMDNNLALPDNFSYTIHSQNPVGSENIKSYMESYLKHVN